MAKILGFAGGYKRKALFRKRVDRRSEIIYAIFFRIKKVKSSIVTYILLINGNLPTDTHSGHLGQMLYREIGGNQVNPNATETTQ